MNGEVVLDIAHRGAATAYTALLRSSFRTFGRHSKICPPLRLHGAQGITIGHGVFLDRGCWLQYLGEDRPSGADRGLVIGDDVNFSGSAVISAAESVVIENAVTLARGVFVADHDHRFDAGDVPIGDQGITDPRPVRIGYGSWLGQNVVVTSGVTIGRFVTVGANSVVTRDLPDHAVAVGAPATVLRIVTPG